MLLLDHPLTASVSRLLFQLATPQEQGSPFPSHPAPNAAVTPVLGSHAQIFCSSVEMLELSVLC